MKITQQRLPCLNQWVYMCFRFAEYFKKHPEIDIALQNDLLRFYNVLECSFSASDTWYEPSIKAELRYEKCEGNISINWKQNGYSTILDILMVRIRRFNIYKNL